MAFSLNDKHIIVAYHHIRDPHEAFSGIHPCSIREFERQMRFLSSNFRITTIQDVFKNAQEKSSERVCAVTFDDGIRDNFQNAVPVLKKHNMTATFFIIAGVFDGVCPATHKIHFLLSRMSAEELIDRCNEFLERASPHFVSRFYISKDKLPAVRIKIFDDAPTANFKEGINALPLEIRNNFLEKLFSDLKINEKELVSPLFMFPKEVNTLKNDGFHIGSHGYSHESLDCISWNEVGHEIRRSRDILTDMSGSPVTLFAYPQSIPDRNFSKYFKKEGFTHAVSIKQREVFADDNPFLLPRYDTNDIRDFLNTQ